MSARTLVGPRDRVLSAAAAGASSANHVPSLIHSHVAARLHLAAARGPLRPPGTHRSRVLSTAWGARPTMAPRLLSIPVEAPNAKADAPDPRRGPDPSVASGRR